MKPILDKKYIKNALKKASIILQRGELVIFPTETVYGIGATANNEEAIKLIYKSKKRPLANPLICHFKNIREIKKNFYMNNLEIKLAKFFWPGPLTLILEKKKDSKISSILSKNKKFVGCRVPNNKIALSLLKSLQFPVAAPSANINTKISTTQSSDIDLILKKKVFVIRGKSNLGLESTVVQIKNNKIHILRLGSITEEVIKKALKNIKIVKKISSKLSPGYQKKHYSPNLPIRLNINKVKVASIGTLGNSIILTKTTTNKIKIIQLKDDASLSSFI